VFAGAFLYGSTPALADLVIRVETSTRKYSEPAQFDLSVIMTNGGDAPLIVLPQSLRREYLSLESGTAHYSPYPGPPSKPWRDAFVLTPDQSHTWAVRGMGDGDGVWRLEPGRYELSARLSVTTEQAKISAPELTELGATIWEGEIQSAKLIVIYSPEPSN
jgi:hypothetical protein